MQLTAAQAQAIQTAHMLTNGIVIWCVTTNTKDFGNAFVARPIVAPNLGPRLEDGYLLADSLEALRALLPEGLSCMAPDPTDNPVIVETWI